MISQVPISELWKSTVGVGAAVEGVADRDQEKTAAVVHPIKTISLSLISQTFQANVESLLSSAEHANYLCSKRAAQ